MKKLLLFFCSLVTTAAIQAQIIHVPGDYPTIQQGINAADSGDIVLVGDSTYYEQINFKGKRWLTVASEFLIDGDTNHIAGTIINGSQPLNPDSASVVYFVSGEDTTSILCGFTITGGRGTINFDTIWGWARVGGGIWISGSSAKIRNNIITRNRCEDFSIPDSGYTNSMGGGIATSVEQDDFWRVIEGNVIDSNYVISNKPLGGCTGGGISIFNNCRIINNIIKNNVAENLINTVYWSQGAGAGVAGIYPSWNKIAVIQNNQFLNNMNNSNKAYGGGMKVANMHLTCSHNTFMSNRVESDISMDKCWGAGLEAYGFLEGSVISYNTYKENYSEETDAGLVLSSDPSNTEPIIVENNYFLDNKAETIGGAFGVYDCPVIFQNNVFNGNEAGSAAVGHITSATSQTEHTAWLLNNSFANNKAETWCGSIKAVRTRPFILNCIFWENSANTANELWASGNSEFEIAYSDIDTTAIVGNRIIGPGVFHEDPLFSDTINLIPDQWSPCIDAGVVEYSCYHGETVFAPDYDITGVRRPVGNTYDIGAYEYPYIVGIRDRSIKISTLNCQNYPSPFTTGTTFSYTIHEPEQVILQIFNSFGQLVSEPVNSFQQKGEQKVEWNAGSLPAGMYYYRIQAGSQVGSGKMVKW